MSDLGDLEEFEDHTIQKAPDSHRHPKDVLFDAFDDDEPKHGAEKKKTELKGGNLANGEYGRGGRLQSAVKKGSDNHNASDYLPTDVGGESKKDLHDKERSRGGIAETETKKNYMAGYDGREKAAHGQPSTRNTGLDPIQPGPVFKDSSTGMDPQILHSFRSKGSRSPEQDERSRVDSAAQGHPLGPLFNLGGFPAYYNKLQDFEKERLVRLYQKNSKLKEELLVISKAIEEIVAREKDKRRKKDKLEDDSDVIRQMKIIREQQVHITHLKTKTEKRKKELDEAYQYPMVREKEDQLRDLKRQLRELYEQREGAMKVRSEQTRAVSHIEENNTELNRKRQLEEELFELKKQSKILAEKKIEVYKMLNKNHAKLIDGRIHVRELEKRLDHFKTHKKTDPIDSKDITRMDIEKSKQELADQEHLRKLRSAQHDQNIRDIERMKVDMKKNTARMEKVLREKEKEIRLNTIKMKELRRLQRHKMVKPIANISEKLNTTQEVQTLLKKQDREIREKMLELNIDLGEGDDINYRAAVEREKIENEERKLQDQLARLQQAKEVLNNHTSVNELSRSHHMPVVPESERRPQIDHRPEAQAKVSRGESPLPDREISRHENEPVKRPEFEIVTQQPDKKHVEDKKRDDKIEEGKGLGIDEHKKKADAPKNEDVAAPTTSKPSFKPFSKPAISVNMQAKPETERKVEKKDAQEDPFGNDEKKPANPEPQIVLKTSLSGTKNPVDVSTKPNEKKKSQSKNEEFDWLGEKEVKKPDPTETQKIIPKPAGGIPKTLGGNKPKVISGPGAVKTKPEIVDNTVEKQPIKLPVKIQETKPAGDDSDLDW